MSNRRDRKPSKAERVIQRIRLGIRNYPVDPRTDMLDPDFHTKEEIEYHALLCDDIDLLAATLGPDEWNDDL